MKFQFVQNVLVNSTVLYSTVVELYGAINIIQMVVFSFLNI